MKRLLLHLIIYIGALLSLSSCVTEDVPENTPRGNFESLWQTLNEHYCFFSYKKQVYGLDWDEVYSRYASKVNDNITSAQLFEILSNLTRELRDGHVNLYSSYGTARYGAWFDNFPANYSDSLQRVYLGKTTDYILSSGLSYRILDDNIGYIRCSSFDNSFGSGNLHEMMRRLALCDGLIVDVRSNGGGMLTSAEKLASLFVNERTLGATMCHKTGAAHDAFSAPEPIYIDPFEGLRWQKPVAVLTNRRTYSAANSFVMYLKGLPEVTIVGDKTGGGSGMPFVSELPNGWTLRFSACPMFNRDGEQTEMGIDPDVKVDISSEDYARNVDTIIETARHVVRGK